MVEVKVRVDDIADVRGSQADQGELAHHLVARRRPQAEESRAPLAEAPDRIGESLAMHAGVDEDVASRMRDQEADHGDGHAAPGGDVAEESAEIEINEAAAQGVDVQHGSPQARSRGSRASRTASPTKFNPTTVMNRAAPGPKTIQGACWR